jgi:hypothetical protein
MQNKKFWAALFVLILGSTLFYCSSIGNGPSFDVTFTRDVPSKLSPEYLDKVFQQLPTWHLWFFSASKADEVDFRGYPYAPVAQKLETHGLIRMQINPHRGESRKFEITLLVEEYVPQKRLKLRIMSDSKGRLTRLFDPLEWTLELIPHGTGTIIHAVENGRAVSWRSKLFAKIIPSIFMNQVFYPNLIVLSQINDPLVVQPDPDTQP